MPARPWEQFGWLSVDTDQPRHSAEGPFWFHYPRRGSMIVFRVSRDVLYDLAAFRALHIHETGENIGVDGDVSREGFSGNAASWRSTANELVSELKRRHRAGPGN